MNLRNCCCGARLLEISYFYCCCCTKDRRREIIKHIVVILYNGETWAHEVIISMDSSCAYHGSLLLSLISASNAVISRT